MNIQLHAIAVCVCILVCVCVCALAEELQCCQYESDLCENVVRLQAGRLILFCGDEEREPITD